ncbi:GspH/FimT family protein [Marinimicrobium sp. ABcell2]|uniref:GspH/FimT family pseudopilin n=1 Tax=Marinimicrobium sp. ABcell2 TaxID=3069751 RepID=UPI0027B738CE|nr:GspH/FimT family protein [Marinimicrobium sp. ABcell2]MDQ2078125.1 GspH/FimT family protein [Marinimicrobium sp. ABcell2]
MASRGFTLIELLVVLIVLMLLVAIGIPNLSQHIRESRTQSQAQELFQAVQVARTHAITTNSRVTLRATGSWNEGWQVFMDPNHNGELDPGEKLLASSGPIKGTHIVGNHWVARHISFIGTGESRFANGSSGGAFQAGRITVCGEEGERGYQLVLARSGRMRMNTIESEQCL